MFKKGSLLRRRPSAAMIVACMALFVALSGGAYAATQLPAGSVGNAQLKNGAVNWKKLAAGSVGNVRLANNAINNAKYANNSISYNKIKPGQIGQKRVAQNQIQFRVSGACTGSNAISAVADTGKVTCTPTQPTNFSSPGLSEPLTSATTSTTLAGVSLPANTTYQVTADPYIQVKGTASGQNVIVTCEIAAGSTTETRSISFPLNTAHDQAAGSIPLSINVPASGSAIQSGVACVRGYTGTGAAPTVQASSQVNGLALAANTSSTTPGTSTTSFSITTPTATPPTS